MPTRLADRRPVAAAREWARKKRWRIPRDARPPKITWNTGHASDVKVRRAILRLLRRYHPSHLYLQEVGDRQPVLREVVDRMPGLTLVCHDIGPAADHTAIIVGLPEWGVTVHDSGAEHLTPRTYVGRRTAGARRDGWTAAKYLQWVRTTVLHRREADAVIHWVPSATKRGNHSTQVLWAKQARGTMAWIEERREHAHVAGDTNMVRSHRLAKIVTRTVQVFTRRSRRLRAIDWHMVEPVKGQVHAVVRALRGYPRDHRPVVFMERG